jgi:hypothetical protein
MSSPAPSAARVVPTMNGASTVSGAQTQRRSTTASSTARFIGSPSTKANGIPTPLPTSNANRPKVSRAEKHCAASNATSLAASGSSSRPRQHSRSPAHPTPPPRTPSRATRSSATPPTSCHARDSSPAVESRKQRQFLDIGETSVAGTRAGEAGCRIQRLPTQHATASA